MERKVVGVEKAVWPINTDVEMTEKWTKNGLKESVEEKENVKIPKI